MNTKVHDIVYSEDDFGIEVECGCGWSERIDILNTTALACLEADAEIHLLTEGALHGRDED